MPLPQQSVQSQTVALPPRLPLVTTMRNRDNTFDRDSRLVNAFAEQDPTTEEYWVEKRPGLSVFQTPATGAGFGIYFWNGSLYSLFFSGGMGKAFKDGVFFPSTKGDTSISTFLLNNYHFEELLGTGWLVFNNGNEAYFTNGTTLSPIEVFRNAMPGEYIVGQDYEIRQGGTFDFTTIGSPNNTVGQAFTATGPGDRTKTGQASLHNSWLIAGARYEIVTVGSTNFTLLGAASSTVGVRFTYNGVAGAGTGTVKIPNFPESHVPGWAYLDGTLYVMDKGSKIYGTSTLQVGGMGGFDDPRIWDLLSVIVARTSHGVGVCLAKHASYVVALKSAGTEFFYDKGNPAGSPLGPVQGAHSPYGCASASTVQDIEETILWVTSSVTLSPKVARLDNLAVTIVSTPQIDKILEKANLAAGGTLKSWAFEHSGHKFYGLTLAAESNNMTLVYDLGENLWYQWTDPDGDYWPIVGATTKFDGVYTSFAQASSGGFIYSVAADYILPNDAGVVFPVDIYTPNFDGDTKRRKTLDAMFFDADQNTGGKLFVRVSHDDYQTWTNFREVNLDQVRPTLTKCGTFIRRAWHIRHFANRPMRLKAVDLQIDLGTL